jgi:hypothetical protein
VLLRRRWRSAVGLGVVAAVGGGLVLALGLIARDTSSAVATYVARLDAPEGYGEYCPPGVDTTNPDLETCARYDQRAELDALRSDPDVVAAGRFASTPIRVRAGSDEWREGFAWVSMDGLSAYGDLGVVAGRPADPAAPDEVVVNESFLAEHGARLGDVLEVATITWDEFGAGLSAFAEPAGTVVPMRTVGVVRTAADLTVAVEGNNALSISKAVVALGPPWVERVGSTSFARYRSGVAIDVRSGADLDQVARRVSRTGSPTSATRASSRARSPDLPTPSPTRRGRPGWPPASSPWRCSCSSGRWSLARRGVRSTTARPCGRWVRRRARS